MQETAHVQEEAATKIQAAFRGMQARERVKTMKAEAQVNTCPGPPAQHDDPELVDLDFDLFALAPKSAGGDESKTAKAKVTFSDNCVTVGYTDNACGSKEQLEGLRNLHASDGGENSGSSAASSSDHGSSSSSSSELGDDFELIKDNRATSAFVHEDGNHKSKKSECDAQPQEGSRGRSVVHSDTEDNFPVTKGGLQKSKVSI